MENSLEFIQNLVNYSTFYDENFVDGYIKIISNFGEELVSKKNSWFSIRDW